MGPKCVEPARWVEGPNWMDGPRCSDEDAYQLKEVSCKDVMTLQDTYQFRCPSPRPLPSFQRVTVPVCPLVHDKCCTSAACREFVAVGEECLHRSRRLDAAVCVLSPAGNPRLYAFLGGMLRVTMRCDFSRVSNHLAKIEVA